MSRARTEEIVWAVAEEYGFTPDELRSRDRHKSLVEARQAACLALRRCLRLSFPEIGRALRRDHSTCMHGVEQATLRVMNDAEHGARYLRLFERFRSAGPVEVAAE